MNKITSIFRSLKYNNFRLFFTGLIASQTGIWIQNIAISWIVYNMTNSPLITGIITLCNTAPLFIVTPFSGVIIDKFSKHKLLKTIQILYALQALLITTAIWTGHIRIWNIILLGSFLNTITAIETPLRQSLFIHLIDDKNDLSNSISLNSVCFNLARLIGPAIAGILISSVSEKICFLIDFICFIPAVFLVYIIKVNEINEDKIRNKTIFEGLKEGLLYIKKNNQITTLLCFVGIFSFIGMAYPMLMPIYTKELFHTNADVLGYLMASAGIGALTSSFWLASQHSENRIKRILCTGMCLFGLSYIILGCSHNIEFSILCMFLLGMGMTASITSANTLIQAVSENSKRGRVMSIYAICYMGATSLSSLFTGIITEYVGISSAFLIIGIILLVLSIGFLLKIINFSFDNKN